MIDCFAKILESIVIDKLVVLFEHHAGKFQHGFIRKRGAAQTAIVDYLKHSKKYEARRSKLHVCFLDVEKA